MWNEEKFFKEFSHEMDRIKPDAAFVDELTELAKDDDRITSIQRKQHHNIIKYTACAASVILCALIGGLILSLTPPATKEDLNHPAEEQVSAGKHDESITGSLVNQNKIPSSILSFVKSETTQLKDEEGNVLSEEQRAELLALLDQCTKSDEKSRGDIVDTYYCTNSTNQTIVIHVYESYVEIDHTTYVIHIASPPSDS